MIAALILTVSLFQPLYAQNISKEKRQEMYRMSRNARDAEKNGQVEQAYDIWKYIARENGVDFSSYNGIQRCLTGLARYDELLTFLDSVLVGAKVRKNKLKPVTVAADRVSVLLTAERNEEAETAIEQILSEYRNDSKAYSEIANILFAQRKNEEAIAIYRRGREVLRNPYLYAREIANYSEQRMDWETAISEYLLYLQESPKRLTYVTGVIGDMPAQMGADNLAITIIQDQRLTADPQFRQILTQLQASLHFRARRYSEALKTFVSMGGNSDEQAIFLLEFAQMLLDEEEYRFAWDSYREILLLEPTANLIAEAYLGIGVSAENLGQVDTAKTAYHAALKPGVTAAVAIQAYSRLGYIEMNHYRAPGSARGYFESALKLMKNVKLKPEEIEQLNVASALTWAKEENWSEAEKQLTRIIRSDSRTKKSSAYARSELANLYFRTGDFAKSRQIAESILLADPSSVQANEALAIIVITNDLAKDSLSLVAIGNLDRLMFLEDFEKAEGIIDSLSSSSSMHVREEVFWRQFRMKVDTGQYEAALLSIQNIIEMGGSAYRADMALLNAGELCEKQLNRPNDATKYYETLLIDYPDSPLCNQARRRMKLIAIES